MSVLEIAEMLKRSPEVGDGDVTTLQVVPLKFSMSSPPLPLPRPPTAQTSVGEMAATAANSPPPAVSLPLPLAGRVGVVWTLQDVPLKNSTSGAPEPLVPTAQMSVGETAVTALRLAPETVGLVTTWKPLERSCRDSS